MNTNIRFQAEPAWINRNSANHQAEIFGNTGQVIAPAVARYIANSMPNPGTAPTYEFIVKGVITPALAQAANDRIVQADEDGDMAFRQLMIALLGYIEAVTG